MADLVKVQGSKHQCIQALQVHANQYNVVYKAIFDYFGQKSVKIVRPLYRDIPSIIDINFMWRYEYNQYDNSV